MFSLIFTCTIFLKQLWFWHNVSILIVVVYHWVSPLPSVAALQDTAPACASMESKQGWLSGSWTMELYFIENMQSSGWCLWTMLATSASSFVVLALRIPSRLTLNWQTLNKTQKTIYTTWGTHTLLHINNSVWLILLGDVFIYFQALIINLKKLKIDMHTDFLTPWAKGTILSKTLPQPISHSSTCAESLGGSDSTSWSGIQDFLSIGGDVSSVRRMRMDAER